MHFQPHSNSVAPSTLKAAAFRRRDACITTRPTSRREQGGGGGDRWRMIAEQVGGFLSRRVETRLISPQSCQTTSSGDISYHMKEYLARVTAVNLGGGGAGGPVARARISFFFNF